MATGCVASPSIYCQIIFSTIAEFVELLTNSRIAPNIDKHLTLLCIDVRIMGVQGVCFISLHGTNNIHIGFLSGWAEHI